MPSKLIPKFVAQLIYSYDYFVLFSYTQILFVVLLTVAYSEAAPRAIEEASDAWYNYFGHGHPWRYYGYPQR